MAATPSRGSSGAPIRSRGRRPKTTQFRAFESTVVPGLLQTAGYAQARLAEDARVFGLARDVDEAVQVHMRRQEVLYRPDKQFHFVLTESALRLRLCPVDVMLGQLDRLVSLSALPRVKLGIIGLDTTYRVAPWHGFWLLDHNLVRIETYSAELNLAQPQEIALYGAVFESLASVASYGRAARKIITTVIDDLTPAGSGE